MQGCIDLNFLRSRKWSKLSIDQPINKVASVVPSSPSVHYHIEPSVAQPVQAGPLSTDHITAASSKEEKSINDGNQPSEESQTQSSAKASNTSSSLLVIEEKDSQTDCIAASPDDPQINSSSSCDEYVNINVLSHPDSSGNNDVSEEDDDQVEYVNLAQESPVYENFKV